jgi:branched-subunit amino acid ABC-type transport system permease component
VITVHGWDVSQQMLLSGVVQGLAYAVLAAGIVLVYRASGVINFAVAAFGTTAVAFMAVLLGSRRGDRRGHPGRGAGRSARDRELLGC